MHYFRYRPYSELSLKELLYSEMYFASTEECNDPFDSKTFYSFLGDVNKWSNLITLACKPFLNLLSEPFIKELSEFICNQCPLTYEEAINKNLLAGFSTNLLDNTIAISQISIFIQSFLKVYQPDDRYFVSFSRKSDDPLMWSHYANNHRGFCLIFKSI